MCPILPGSARGYFAYSLLAKRLTILSPAAAQKLPPPFGIQRSAGGRQIDGTRRHKIARRCRAVGAGQAAPKRANSRQKAPVRASWRPFAPVGARLRQFAPVAAGFLLDIEAQVLMLTKVSNFRVILPPPADIQRSASGRRLSAFRFQLSTCSFQFSIELSILRSQGAHPPTLPATTTFARANV
jgi:hypothetical protein